MTVTGLILAAGASRRMGASKALLDLGGETFLDRLILAFSTACSPLLVVLGHDAARIRDAVRLAARVRFVYNPDHEKGQLSSLQCGLAAVPVDSPGVVFTPVDYPSVRLETVDLLVRRFAGRAEGDVLVIPRTHGRRGHPVSCAREVIPDFLRLPPDGSARDVIHRYRDRTLYVDTDDPGIVEDADDPEAYQRLLEAFRRP